MNQADAIDIAQLAVWTTLSASGPVILVAMLTGVAIALVQALTQIQEITLTFVPKIVSIFLAISIAAPFMGQQLGQLTDVLYSRIATGF